MKGSVWEVLSKGLQEEIEEAMPPIGKQAVFEVLGEGKETINGQERMVYPSAVIISAHDIIIDPHSEGKKRIEIGLVDSYIQRAEGKDIVRYQVFTFLRENAGKVVLVNDDSADFRDRFAFLFLSNYNQDNKVKSEKQGSSTYLKGKRTRYKSLQKRDLLEELKANHERLEEVLKIVNEASEGELRIFCKALKVGFSDTHSEEELNLLIRDKINKDSESMEALMRVSDSVTAAASAMIEEAKTKRVIIYHEDKKEWTWAGESVGICRKQPNRSPEESLLDYLFTAHGRTLGRKMKEKLAALPKDTPPEEPKKPKGEQ